jgi:hypothetical protein
MKYDYYINSKKDFPVLIENFKLHLEFTELLQLTKAKLSDEPMGLALAAALASFPLFARALNEYLDSVDLTENESIHQNGYVIYPVDSTRTNKFAGYISPALKLELFILAAKIYLLFKNKEYISS